MKNFTFTLLGVLLSLNVYSQSTATYDISLTTIWNSTNHTSVPSNAHWSPLVGATHNTANEFFELGAVSPITDGIKDVAELGNSTNFQGEVTAAISNNKADQWLNTGGISGAVGTFTINNLQVNENFPLITLVSMIAPSPDWFIAVNSENLRSINNGWKDTYTIDVFAYDSGTDDGTDYTSGDAVSNPRVGVFNIIGAPINGNRMGTITFTFKGATLSTISTHSIENIKIYPNPTNVNISISNIQNIKLKSVEFYNILGRFIKQISVENSTSKTNINLKGFSKGIYLLKLNTLDGNSKTQKLIVE